MGARFVQDFGEGRVAALFNKITRDMPNGKAGSLNDLKLTAHAKGELCLEDVWLAIDIH